MPPSQGGEWRTSCLSPRFGPVDCVSRLRVCFEPETTQQMMTSPRILVRNVLGDFCIRKSLKSLNTTYLTVHLTILSKVFFSIFLGENTNADDGNQKSRHMFLLLKMTE